MRYFRMQTVVILTIFTLSLAACETQPDIENPTTYQKDGIAFVHPDDWQITEDDILLSDIDVRFISLEPNSDTMLMIIELFRPGLDGTLREFAQGISNARRGEALNYGDISTSNSDSDVFSPINKQILGLSRNGYREEFVMSDGSNTVASYCEYFEVPLDSLTIVTMAVATVDGWEEASKAFDAVYATLKADQLTAFNAGE